MRLAINSIYILSSCLPWNVICSQLLVIGTWISLGDDFSPITYLIELKKIGHQNFLVSCHISHSTVEWSSVSVGVLLFSQNNEDSFKNQIVLTYNEM